MTSSVDGQGMDEVTKVGGADPEFLRPLAPASTEPRSRAVRAWQWVTDQLDDEPMYGVVGDQF